MLEDDARDSDSSGDESRSSNSKDTDFEERARYPGLPDGDSESSNSIADERRHKNKKLVGGPHRRKASHSNVGS
jgi:hypothetical protein